MYQKTGVAVKYVIEMTAGKGYQFLQIEEFRTGHKKALNTP